MAHLGMHIFFYILTCPKFCTPRIIIAGHRKKLEQMDGKYSEIGKYDNNDCSTSNRSFDW